MRLQHAVVTMFNRRLGGRRTFPPERELDADWLRYRWKLFTTYTVPSVAAQTEKNFTWLILFHPDTPAWLRRLTDGIDMTADVYCSFRHPDPALAHLERGSADALLVTRIDSDDFWHRQAVERIQEDCWADPYTSELVTFTDGYLLDDKTRRMRPYHHISPPFCTKINLDPDLDPLDLGGNHSRVWRRFTVRSISEGEPMFVSVAHKANNSRRQAFDPADARWLTAQATAEILGRDFGVTLANGAVEPPVTTVVGHPRGARKSGGTLGPPARAAGLVHQRVVVSIPCFRAWDSAARAVESILGQTYRNVLVVVANDGDAEARWAALSHIDDPRLIRIDYPLSRGRFFVDQIALMARLGHYLLIQDATGWSEPDRVAALLEEMRRQHCVAAVSSQYRHNLAEPGAAAVVSPVRAPAPVTPLYPDGLTWPSAPEYRGLFDAPRLLRVGGCYGGYRTGYGPFLSQLIRMTGAVARVDRPLHHLVVDPDRDGPSPGESSYPPSAAELTGLYEEAYHTYCEYLQGYAGLSAFCQELRALAWRHVPKSEWDVLHSEACRLRWHARTSRRQAP